MPSPQLWSMYPDYRIVQVRGLGPLRVMAWYDVQRDDYRLRVDTWGGLRVVCSGVRTTQKLTGAFRKIVAVLRKRFHA